jgi:hypothetical protein
LPDVIPSGRTPTREAAISDHPCLKPQHFMRVLVRALLPLGEGVVLDSFMGSGSTLAAAEAVGYEAIGVEVDAHYFTQAREAIPRLTALYPGFQGQETEFEVEYGAPVLSANQLDFALAERAAETKQTLPDSARPADHEPKPGARTHTQGGAHGRKGI